MDYEKAYKEALERAKKLHGCPEYDAELEEIFPELAESEDEKIRKMLVEQVERWKKCAEDNNVEQDVKDASAAIAYLEKQKEQKPAGWSEGDEGYLQLVIRLVQSDIGENSPTVRWLKALPGRINPQPKQERNVDWEEEVQIFIQNHEDWDDDNELLVDAARYFWNRGYNARKRKSE